MKIMISATVKQPFGILWADIEARKPKAHYRRCRWWPDEYRTYLDEKGAKEALRTAKNIVRFMDRTGYRPSEAFVRVFGAEFPLRGFDHTLLWNTPDGGRVITTEPYGVHHRKEIEEWAEAHGWTVETFPKKNGIWYACGEECPSGCRIHCDPFLLRRKGWKP